jgi:DNA-binding response OmpR family regulator
VLVVDDNADIRAFVRRHLTPTYRVVEAADGREGLAVARRLTPDCIVSDVMMPEMDGTTLLRALRDDPATDFLPVILLTARAALEDKLGGLEAGADDYLTKPFRPAELITRIRNLIAQRMRLRERFQAEPPAATADEVEEEPPPFLRAVTEAIRAHLSDEDFGVGELATAVGVSRSKLYRDLKAAADASPGDLIWQTRLAEGRQLLEAEEGTVSEVAYGVGFKSVAHFSNRFREAYGVSPSAVHGADAQAAS